MLHRALEVIKEITAFYKAKEGRVKPPEIYLRAKVAKIQMSDGREVSTRFTESDLLNQLSLGLFTLLVTMGFLLVTIYRFSTVLSLGKVISSSLPFCAVDSWLLKCSKIGL
jgi:hypothetical protein